MFPELERSELDLMDVLAFARVVETGSFARAADRLGISKSIVSRRVARLERTLGAPLLIRSARGAEPTDVGADYHRRLTGVFGELEAAREAVSRATSEISGTIRVTAPTSFTIAHLSSALADFLKVHPRVEIELSLDDRRVDLVAGHFDLALRIGNLPDSSLLARKLATMHAVAVASPAYLEAHGRPTHPRDLVRHVALIYTNTSVVSEWRFRKGGVCERVRVSGPLRSDNGDLLREVACKGLGVVLLPMFAAEAALRDGSLVTVLDDWSLGEFGLYALMPPGRATTARVRALVEHLARSLSPKRD